MLLNEVLTQAWTSIVTHRFRASLTMLGIAWGIVTVVMMMAYGNGFHRALEVGFRNAFASGTVVAYGGTTSAQAGGERAGRRIRLKAADVEAIRELGTIQHVSAEAYDSMAVSYGMRLMNTGVRAVEPEYALMRSETAAQGRFINQEDVANHRRVAFIGTEVQRKLFSNIPPVGETIRIGGLPFEVVGVMADKVQLSNYFYPDKMSVFIPLSVGRQLWAQDYLDTIVFQSVNGVLHDRAVRQVREVLAARHRFAASDDRAVRLNDSVRSLAVVGGISAGLKVILVFIGTLTLMIGGVGVMNIMLVSVTERTREIGVRKALGARRRHILLQFLLEAIAITFAGGVGGIALSALLVVTVRSRPFLAALLGDRTGQTDIQLVLSPDVLLVATAVLVTAGVLSGLWPAVRASRLDPIEALRYE